MRQQWEWQRGRYWLILLNWCVALIPQVLLAHIDYHGRLQSGFATNDIKRDIKPKPAAASHFTAYLKRATHQVYDTCADRQP